MKDIKHIIPDFHSVAWVMPQGWDFGEGTGGLGVKKKYPQIQPNLVCELLNDWHLQRRNFLGSPHPGDLGRAKGSNIIKFQLQSQFQIFLNQTFVCVFSHMKDIKHIRQYFHSIAWVMLSVLGGQKLNFLNIVMLHIKLKKDDQRTRIHWTVLP